MLACKQWASWWSAAFVHFFFRCFNSLNTFVSLYGLVVCVCNHRCVTLFFSDGMDIDVSQFQVQDVEGKLSVQFLLVYTFDVQCYQFPCPLWDCKFNYTPSFAGTV